MIKLMGCGLNVYQTNPALGILHVNAWMSVSMLPN